MTNPTNLTDEGLTEMAKQLRRSWRDWMNQSPMAPKDVEAGITPPWMYATDEYELDRRIKSALQQVRDAAKKEERERCAKVAEGKAPMMPYKAPAITELCNRIAKAIRQMGGGN